MGTEHFDSKAADWDNDPDKVSRAQEVAAAVAASVPLTESTRLLEYGAGTGLVSQSLSERVAEVVLADNSAGMREVMSQKIEAGTLPAQARVWDLDLERDPVPDEEFDLVVTSMVLHHVRDLPAVLTGFAALLRPGGHLFILTVNQWFPLIVLGRLLPHGIRQTVNAFLTHSDERDTFPAYYRANTAKALAGLGQAAGLTPVNIQYLCHPPTYFAFSPLGFRIWAAFDRQILARKTFAGIRHMLMGCFEKKPDAGELKTENRES